MKENTKIKENRVRRQLAKQGYRRGTGKTQWAIAYMNAHPQEAFIVVTPFLSEVERIKQGATVEDVERFAAI